MTSRLQQLMVVAACGFFVLLLVLARPEQPAPRESQPAQPSATTQIRPASPTPQQIVEGTPVPWPAAPIAEGDLERVVELARWGRGTANSIAVTLDDTRLAVASSNGIALYSLPDLQQLTTIGPELGHIQLSISADGQTIASEISEGDIAIWQLNDGREIFRLSQLGGPITDLDLAADGQSIAVATQQHGVRLYRTSDGERLPMLQEHDGAISAYSAAFAPDGSMLALVVPEGRVELRTPDGRKLIRTLGRLVDFNSLMRFSADSSMLAVSTMEADDLGGLKTEINLWNPGDGSHIQSFEPKQSTSQFTGLLSMELSADGQTIALLWDDQTIQSWTRGERGPTYMQEAPRVRAIRLASSSQLLSLGVDGAIKLFDLAGRRYVDSRHDYTQHYMHASISAGGRLVALLKPGGVELRQLADGSLYHYLPTLGDAPKIAFSPDGATLALADQVGSTPELDPDSAQVTQHTLQLLDLEQLTSLSVATGYTPINALTFDPAEGLVVAASAGEVRFWHPDTGKLVRSLTLAAPGAASISSIAISPDGRALIANSWDGSLHIWDAHSGEELRRITGTSHSQQVAFAPDGGSIVALTLSFGVQLVELDAQNTTRFFDARLMGSFAFSPDGLLLATGQSDSIKLWRLTDAALLRTIPAHTAEINALAFSPDGYLLLSCSTDGTARLWGVQ